MKEEYSKEWIDFMGKEEAFRKASAFYNLHIDLETQKKDILQSFESRNGRLITTRLMSKGYIHPEAIELVWDKLVYLVFYGVNSVSSWAVSSLMQLPSGKRKKYRREIGRLALEYADKEKQDDIALMFGLDLLYKMKCKEEILLYIERFKEYLDLDENDILYYQDISE